MGAVFTRSRGCPFKRQCQAIYVRADLIKALLSALREGVGGVAIGTAEIAAGEADENAGESGERAFALDAHINFVDLQISHKMRIAWREWE